MDSPPAAAAASASAIVPPSLNSPSPSPSPAPAQPSPSQPSPPQSTPPSPSLSYLLPSASATASPRSIALPVSTSTSPSPSSSTTTNAPSSPPPPPSSTKHDPQSWNYIWKTFLAGGIAGCAAKSAVAPLDRVKILFQTNSPHFAHHRGSLKGVFRAAVDIRAQQGLGGLFQGHSATLIRIFPYAAIKFMAFEQYKHVIFPKEGQGRAGPGHQLLAGSLAGVTSVFFTYPLEVVRVRLAFSRDPHSLRSLLKLMWHEKPHVHHPLPAVFPQGLTNFYRGFLPTVYGMIPYAGVSFATYESTKRHLHDQFPGWSKSATHLVAGGLAGAISQTVAYPFEVIRRRMQVSGQFHVESFEARVYRTTVETARYIWRHHGMKGFFVGLSIGYMKVVPMSMVSFWTYEASKRVLGIE